MKSRNDLAVLAYTNRPAQIQPNIPLDRYVLQYHLFIYVVVNLDHLTLA